MLDNGRGHRRNGIVRHLPAAAPERQIEDALDVGCPRLIAQAIAARAAGPITVTIGTDIVTVVLVDELPASSITNIWQDIAAAHRDANTSSASFSLLDLPAPVSRMTWAHNGRTITITSTGQRRGTRRRSPRGPAAALPVLGLLSEAGIKVAAIGSVASAIAFGSVPAAPPPAEAAPTPGAATPAVVTPPYTAWPLTPSTSPSPEAPRARHDAPRPPAPPVPLPTATPLPQPTEGPSPSPTPPEVSPAPTTETPTPAPSTDPPAPYATPADPTPSGPPADTAPEPPPSPEPSPEQSPAPTAAPEPPPVPDDSEPPTADGQNGPSAAATN